MTLGEILLIKNRTFLALYWLFAISGCTVTTAYNYLDWYVAWQVDDFVELTREQEATLEQEIKRIHDWHRKSELKKYIVLIESINLAIKKSDPSIIPTKIEDIRQIWRQSTIYVTPSIIVMLQTLTSEQKKELLSNIERLQQEHKDEWLELEEQGFERKRKMRLDRLEDYLGSLDNGQEQLFYQLSDQLINTTQLRIDSRRSWLSKFKRALMVNGELDDSAITPLFTDFTSYRSDEHQQAIEHNRLLYISFLQELVRTLSAKQKKHVERKLSEVVDTLEDLNS